MKARLAAVLGLWLVIAGCRGEHTRASVLDLPRDDLASLTERVSAAARSRETAPARRLGLLRALRYVRTSADVIDDGLPLGRLDDWLVLQAAAGQYLPARPEPDVLLRARAARVAASLPHGARERLASTLEYLLLDPTALGAASAAEIETALALELAAPDAAWSVDALARPPHVAALRWLELPRSHERSAAGWKLTLIDGTVIVEPL